MLRVYLFLYLFLKVVISDRNGFTFYERLKPGEVEEISPNGTLKFANKQSWGIGYSFYSAPFAFKNSSNGTAHSFSTTFVISIFPEIHNRSGLGMAFIIAPSKQIPGTLNSAYLGVVNSTQIGDPSNHMFSIEFDTSQELEFEDINDNHVGVNINGVASIKAAPAGYFSNENGGFNAIRLASGGLIQVWVDYDGVVKQLNVTISPINRDRPSVPLISLDFDLSPIILDQMYVGFGALANMYPQSYYVLGWSFELDGEARELNISRLASLPRKKETRRMKMILAIGVPLVVVFFAAVMILVAVWLARKRRKFSEILEDWEVQCGPHRFRYKDLFVATKGFGESELMGKGGFGQVYKGVLPSSNIQVAVKRVSHDSSQRVKEFVAEICTIGRLRHPNLVRLLGYCRCEGELFLVYDFMPNASLDRFLFKKPKPTLRWNQRFKIIKDVATGLAYLHEQWVEVIIHRDIKASNVLLDADLNGKLGDFGLARRSDHGNDPQTTHLAGTLGYIAPELARNGKATTCTDVFAFGAFCLEVACGRRPVNSRAPPDEALLVDWVWDCWKKEEILRTVDDELMSDKDLNVDEIELVLKLGLFCSHPVGGIRPCMSLVLQYLKGDALLPGNLDALLSNFVKSGRFSSESKDSSISLLTFTESITGCGR